MIEAIDTRSIRFDDVVADGLVKAYNFDKGAFNTFGKLNNKDDTYIDTSYEAAQSDIVVGIDNVENYKINTVQGILYKFTDQISLRDWIIGQAGCLPILFQDIAHVQSDPTQLSYGFYWSTSFDIEESVKWIIDKPDLFISSSHEARTVDFSEVSFEKADTEIEKLFMTANEEEFEDGMENEFSKNLLSIIRQCENYSINVIQDLILKEKINPEVAGEALRWLGDLDHEPTYSYRQWLLEIALVNCSSVIVRDGANVGLALMDDPHAIPFFKEALKNEKCNMFSKVLQQTLNQLENTKKCLSSSE